MTSVVYKHNLRTVSKTSEWRSELAVIQHLSEKNKENLVSGIIRSPVTLRLGFPGLHRRLMIDSISPNLYKFYGSFHFSFSGVAGLDNLDLMTKTLDRAKQFHLPMSVGGMSTNRLRMLMAAAGRRK